MLRVEMHCHTRASSDGMITPDGLLRAATLQKLDAVAITDHDTVEGAFEFQHWFRRKGSKVEILVGEERTLEGGCHLIGLFLKEAIRSLSLADTVAEIHAQGGLVLVPHPCRAKDGLLGNRGPGLEALAAADAFEIHNAKGSAEDNSRARGILREHGLAFFGGSDAHYEADVGQCVNEITPLRTMEQSIRAMIARQAAFRVLARPQQAAGGERRYAPAYYRIKKFAALPRPLLPAAKAAYRWYWNLRHGGRPHELEEVAAVAARS